MKRKSTSQGLATKKSKTSAQRYDAKTGKWTSGTTTRLSAATAAAVRSQVLEKKGMDTDVSLTTGNVLATTNTNAGCFVLNLIPTGTGSWNRVGRKTIMKSVRVQGIILNQSTPAATTGTIRSQMVRMVLVWDKQPSGGTIPTFDTVFGITTQDGTESCPTIYCPPRYDNMDRFRVLRDVCVDLDTNATGLGGTTNAYIQQAHIDEYLKLPDLESVYLGQSATMTIADISTGALYLYFRAQVNGAADAQASVVASARVRYTD